MSTEVLKVDPASVDAEVIGRAVKILRSGGVVGFPTETVYGVAARADVAAAVDRLRSAKERASHHPFTLHIASGEDALRFAPDLSGVARRLMRRAWPGPLTLIVDVESPPSAPAMVGLEPDAVAAIYHNGTVGLRCPSDPVARELLRSVSAPVVAASANIAGDTPPLSAGEVVATGFADRLDLLIDAGPTRYAKASTIVRVVGSGYELIRDGVYDAGIVGRFAQMHILLVCTGNTCRSPMAAEILKKLLAKRLGCSLGELPKRGIFVTSAGTGGGGAGAASHAIDVMSKQGLDLSTHVSTGITEEAVRAADHIFSMTASHQSMVLQIDPSAVDRARLVLGDRDVADPVGGDYGDYERCAADIEAGLRDRLEEISI